MTHASAGEERRCSPRAPINEFVDLYRNDIEDSARARAVNVSSSGIAVADCLLGEVGDHVVCRMPFTPREPLELGCRIVWVREATEVQPAAMGLCFEEVTETRSDRLATLVSRIQGAGDSTPLTSLPIDPFCEAGTWNEDDPSGSFDESLSSQRRLPYQRWVPPEASTGSAAGPVYVSWRLVALVALALLMALLALGVAAFLLLVD